MCIYTCINSEIYSKSIFHNFVRSFSISLFYTSSPFCSIEFSLCMCMCAWFAVDLTILKKRNKKIHDEVHENYLSTANMCIFEFFFCCCYSSFCDAFMDFLMCLILFFSFFISGIIIISSSQFNADDIQTAVISEKRNLPTYSSQGHFEIELVINIKDIFHKKKDVN